MRPGGPVRPPRDPKLAALDLLRLANLVTNGQVRLPREGQGPMQIDGRVVIPDAVHGVVCGFRSSTLLEVGGEPPVRECHGCGLLRLVDETGTAPDPPEAVPVAGVVPIRSRAR